MVRQRGIKALTRWWSLYLWWTLLMCKCCELCKGLSPLSSDHSYRTFKETNKSIQDSNPSRLFWFLNLMVFFRVVAQHYTNWKTYSRWFLYCLVTILLQFYWNTCTKCYHNVDFNPRDLKETFKISESWWCSGNMSSGLFGYIQLLENFILKYSSVILFHSN